MQIVGVNAETVTNVTSTDFPGHYPGEDHAWDLNQFENVGGSISIEANEVLELTDFSLSE